MSVLVDITSEIEAPKINDIPARFNSEISYDYFFKNVLQPNLPCLISNVAKLWESSSNWSKDEVIDYDYLCSTYGDLNAPVANCSVLECNAHVKSNMLLSNFMDYLRNENKKELLYLKDWHLRKTLPSDNFYQVPIYFASDWLNEYALDKNEDDFMFVYIGPENSWTPFHVDVYNSYSWSVNVIGKKKWLLFPPGEEDKLRDQFSNLPINVEDILTEGIQYYEIIQEQGDAIFVPSGWHHQVKNLKNTISINHNWVNGCNISFVWSSMKNNLEQVEKEIGEFRADEDFQEQCQRMLKALFGMNYNEFAEFLVHIAEKRLRQLEEGHNVVSFGTYEFSKNHVMFEIKAIQNVLKLMLVDLFYKDNKVLIELINKINSLITK